MEKKERDEILRKEAEREEKVRRRMEREDRRRQRKLDRKNVNDEEEMNRRIAIEERKLLVAQRKLESIRMLDELLERVKVICSLLFYCRGFHHAEMVIALSAASQHFFTRAFF